MTVLFKMDILRLAHVSADFTQSCTSSHLTKPAYTLGAFLAIDDIMDCHADATCNQGPDGASCECNTNYIGNGTHCSYTPCEQGIFGNAAFPKAAIGSTVPGVCFSLYSGSPLMTCTAEGWSEVSNPCVSACYIFSLSLSLG